jgi:hypothetical protein
LFIRRFAGKFAEPSVIDVPTLRPQLRLSQWDLGGQMGKSRENASRQLAQLRHAV